MSESAGGYVRLYRKVFNSAEVGHEAATLGLWTTLLLRAQWKPAVKNGVHLEAGQLIVSLRRLAEDCGLSLKQVRRRLDRWRSAGMIRTHHRAHRFTVVTICNWALYNGSDGQADTPQETEGARRGHAGQRNPIFSSELSCPNKGRRKEKRPLEETGGLEGFARFWAAYPKKRNKAGAEKAWAKIRPDLDLQGQILRAIEAFKKSPDWQRSNGQFIPYPASWLNGRRWEDELESEKAEPVEAHIRQDLRTIREALEEIPSHDVDAFLATKRSRLLVPQNHEVRREFEALARLARKGASIQ